MHARSQSMRHTWASRNQSIPAFLMEMGASVHGTKIAIFLVTLTVLTNKTKSQRHTYWKSDSAFFNRIAKQADVTSPTHASNSLDCVKKCVDQNDCNSVFFDKIKKECWPQTSVFISPNGTTLRLGFRYFRINSASCPFEDGYVVHRQSGTCFRPVDWPVLMWTDARDKCASDGGTLAILEPVEKLEFFILHFRTNPTVYQRGKSYLIGASRPPEVWNTPFPSTGPDYVWLDGQPLSMAATGPYWFENKPDNAGQSCNILTLRPSKDFLLEDVPRVEKKRRYVCEKPFDG